MGSIGYQLPGGYFVPKAVADLLKPVCPISLSYFSNSISHHPTRIGIFDRGVEMENINLGKDLFPEHSHTRVCFIYLVFCQCLWYCCDRGNVAVCVLISYSLLHKTLRDSCCNHGGSQVDGANVSGFNPKVQCEKRPSRREWI